MPSFQRIQYSACLVLFSCLAAPAFARAEPESTTTTTTSTSTSGTNDAAGEGFEIIPMGPAPAAPSATNPSSAAAEPLPQVEQQRASPPAQREPEREWYGWQTLSADASSFAIMFVGAASDSPELFLVGLGAFTLAAPIIHAVHHGDWTGPSLAMRLGGLGLMVGGALVALAGGCIFGDEELGSDCSTRAVIGSVLVLTGLASSVSAIVLDALFARAKPRRPGTPDLALWTDPHARAAGVSLTVVQ